MEIRIRDGNGHKLICELTGVSEDALIKMSDDNGKGETPWIGIEALHKAYRILSPLLKNSPTPNFPLKREATSVEVPFAVQMTDAPAPVLSPAPAPPVNHQKQYVLEELKVFERELLDLIDDPPPAADGKPSSGLSQGDIGRLISDHQGRFQDPNALFPVLQRHLGMERIRFEHIIESNRKARNRA